MEKAIRTIFFFGPLIFGFGFIAPLCAQIIAKSDLGLTALQAGLIVGGALGLIAQVRGRWV
jgi:hypothetical protein